MATGLLMSFFGTSVVGGVVPGAIAASALSILWLPVLQTVEMVEDLMSPAVARMLRDSDPGKVLLGCEAFDAAACSVALATVWLTGIEPYTVLVCYLLVASVVPLLVDVAEELFAGKIARVSPDGVLQFNITLYAAIGLVGSLLARPMGSALSDIALPAALAANVASSLAAVVLRLLAVRSLPAGNGQQAHRESG